MMSSVCISHTQTQIHTHTYTYLYKYIYILLLLSDAGTSSWVIVEALLLVETTTLNLTC